MNFTAKTLMKTRGITLIELLIVMIVIAILSVVIFVSMTASIKDGSETGLADKVDSVNTALKQWIARMVRAAKESEESDTPGPLDVMSERAAHRIIIPVQESETAGEATSSCETTGEKSKSAGAKEKTETAQKISEKNERLNKTISDKRDTFKGGATGVKAAACRP